MRSKRYSRPYIHIRTFPLRTTVVWNLMIDSWADWCLCWLAGGVVPQLFSPETLQWILRLQMTSTAKGCRAWTSTGPGGFAVVQVATTYPSLCCVNRIIGAEISPPLHWTAHHRPSAKICWEQIHIPHNLVETEDGWRDGRALCPHNNCEFGNQDSFKRLSNHFADDKNKNNIRWVHHWRPLGPYRKMNLSK